jgi:hypothetical protein
MGLKDRMKRVCRLRSRQRLGDRGSYCEVEMGFCRIKGVGVGIVCGEEHFFAGFGREGGRG